MFELRSGFHVSPRRIFLLSNFTLRLFLDQFESLSYRSLVYTEFGGLTGIKVIRNFLPNFASFDRSFFEFVWLTDEYFPAEKEIVLFLSFHACAHHFYNFNQLASSFIAQNKKVTNNVHLMKFENLKTCGSLWGNNSNSTHVDWWTAKHHFSRPRHKQDCNPRGPGMRIVVYTRNLLPVSRPRGQPSRYLKLSNV